MLSRIRTALLFGFTLAGGITTEGRADHRHFGGHHHHHGYGYGSGFGYRGGGFRLYIGPGYGLNSGYGSGFYGGTRYYSPGYSTPIYVQPSYVLPNTPSSQFVQPSYRFIEPNAGGDTMTPFNRSIPAPPTFDGGPLVLSNPATNDKPIEYSLNGTRFSIKPGQSQKFVHDREWVVEFDRGPNFGPAQYSLKAAHYKFKPTTSGWELFESANPVAPHGGVPTPPENDPQPSGPSNFGTSETVPATSVEPTSSSIPRVPRKPVEQVVPKRKLPSPPEPATGPNNRNDKTP